MSEVNDSRIPKYGPRLTQGGHAWRAAVLRDVLNEGLSCDAIASRVGLSAPRISQLIRTYGLVRPAKTCRGCASEFLPSRARQRYCRPACKSIKVRDRLAERTCLVCGSSFRPVESRHIYCSEQCGDRMSNRQAYYRNRGREMPANLGVPTTPGTCVLCGAAFVFRSPVQRYCSTRCRNRTPHRLEYLRRKNRARRAGANES